MRGIFRGKVYGAVTMGERCQVVIPAEIRNLVEKKGSEEK